MTDSASSSTSAYNDLLATLTSDEGITVGPDGLLVHGTLFAYFAEGELVVEVPEARASDLLARGVAEEYSHDGHPDRNWVKVSDAELWPELAHEAHDFVGEPAVGGDS
ncbi:hypothetical protein [Naasia lichenicola]|uniref:TfoX/Sxy family protein n=1 Tax=Naasia lichenicola TaxID=2565933 RepID=A0A4S4FS15_9MICO|nr:hypothetical protein [Naasia lichenicola]THG33078.1 hypothetical protein E6C64_01580 [Naasia lichenicola]